MRTPTSEDSRDATRASLRRIVIEAVVFSVVMIGVVAGAGYLFREPLSQFSTWVVETFGLTGIFGGIFLADAFTFPVIPDTYLFIGVASDTPVLPLLAVASVASVIAGLVAYYLGPFLQHVPLLSSRIERFRPRGERLYRHFGVWTVVIAAMTPVPFSIICYFAGIYDMDVRRFAPATLARIPRIVGYFWLYWLGWAPAIT